MRRQMTAILTVVLRGEYIEAKINRGQKQQILRYAIKSFLIFAIAWTFTLQSLTVSFPSIFF